MKIKSDWIFLSGDCSFLLFSLRLLEAGSAMTGRPFLKCLDKSRAFMTQPFRLQRCRPQVVPTARRDGGRRQRCRRSVNKAPSSRCTPPAPSCRPQTAQRRFTPSRAGLTPCATLRVGWTGQGVGLPLSRLDRFPRRPSRPFSPFTATPRAAVRARGAGQCCAAFF